MVQLDQKPFYLRPQDIDWVEKTIDGMSLEEKVGQLFVHLTPTRDEAELKQMLDRYHIGALRYVGAPAEAIYKQNAFVQAHSKLPLLIASNCEQGGIGGCTDGTFLASAAQCGASQSERSAYDLGYVSGVEAEAIGCNWNFAPVVDIFQNWRNTIINTRAFSNDAEEVIALSKQFMAGLRQSQVAACAKHFPGDGAGERDQHLLMGLNDLSCEDWDASFGKVYQAVIDEGVPSIMIGHICQPAYQRRFHPGLSDGQILPASLSPELLQGLLRGQLGFNGLILTDATHMNGFWQHLPRHMQLPAAINAGCDMILFFNDPEEDFRFMQDAVEDGTISEARLHDALRRILGLKAALRLHERPRMPEEAALAKVGCKEHLALAEQAAEDSITLVKDSWEQLPITPQTHKRIQLHYISGDMGGLLGATDAARAIVMEELRRVGFEVSLNDGNSQRKGGTTAFREQFDAVLVFADVAGFARENVKRIAWATHQSNDIPWYAVELPTVFISLNFTTHLYDVPMCRTYINAYGSSRIIIRKVIEKLMGRSEFHGHCNETVFCGSWDTRL